MYNFYKNFIFLSKKNSNNVIYLRQVFVSPFIKFNSVKKKIHSVKKLILFVKQTHSVKDKFHFQFSFVTKICLFKCSKTIYSVKDKFCFQFSFATNEQV